MIEEYSFGHMLTNVEKYRRDLKIVKGAVKTFNNLFSEGENVAGAFHLTC
jgi:hypothetical protein